MSNDRLKGERVTSEPLQGKVSNEGGQGVVVGNTVSDTRFDIDELLPKEGIAIDLENGTGSELSPEEQERKEIEGSLEESKVFHYSNKGSGLGDNSIIYYLNGKRVINSEISFINHFEGYLSYMSGIIPYHIIALLEKHKFPSNFINQISNFNKSFKDFLEGNKKGQEADFLSEVTNFRNFLQTSAISVTNKKDLKHEINRIIELCETLIGLLNLQTNYQSFKNNTSTLEEFKRETYKEMDSLINMEIIDFKEFLNILSKELISFFTLSKGKKRQQMEAFIELFSEKLIGFKDNGIDTAKIDELTKEFEDNFIILVSQVTGKDRNLEGHDRYIGGYRKILELLRNKQKFTDVVSQKSE